MRQLVAIISFALLSAAPMGQAAPAARLDFCPPHAGCAFGISTLGVSHGLQVYAIDANGDLATNYLGTVAITTTDPVAGLPPAHTFTVADGAVFAFSPLTFNSLPSGYPSNNRQTVTATDSANAISGSVQLAVRPAPTPIVEAAPTLNRPFEFLLVIFVGAVSVRLLSVLNREADS